MEPKDRTKETNALSNEAAAGSEALQDESLEEATGGVGFNRPCVYECLSCGRREANMRVCKYCGGATRRRDDLDPLLFI